MSQKKLDFDRISNVYDCDLRRTRMRGSESHAGWRRRGSACTEWWAVAGGSPLPAAARLCPARAPDLFRAPLSQTSMHCTTTSLATRLPCTEYCTDHTPFDIFQVPLSTTLLTLINICIRDSVRLLYGIAGENVHWRSWTDKYKSRLAKITKP